MDRHRHAGMKDHFSGTSTTILVDTQHALILNYADTKPCNARENLPYRQEQHPRLSSRRTFVEDYPHYRDLSTLLPLDHPRKRDQEAVSTVPPPLSPSLCFSTFRVSIPPTVLSQIVLPSRPRFFRYFCWSFVRLMGKKGFVLLFFVRLTVFTSPPSSCTSKDASVWRNVS